jgi:hypothetical protein
VKAAYAIPNDGDDEMPTTEDVAHGEGRRRSPPPCMSNAEITQTVMDCDKYTNEMARQLARLATVLLKYIIVNEGRVGRLEREVEDLKRARS